MIGRKEVLENLDRRPFEQFRICMSDGRTYDVTHPELCLPGKNIVHVAVPDPKLKRTVLRVDQCALMHIVRFELLGGERRKNRRRKKAD